MTRRLLILVTVLVIAVIVAWFGLQAWIESAGGRGAVEQRLSEAAGLRVELNGDFDVVFLPAPGVRGTDLLIIDPSTGLELAGSRNYSVRLALAPLFEKRVVVDRLSVEWLRVEMPGGQPVAIPSVVLIGFEPEKTTQLEVGLGPFGSVDGQFNWRPRSAAVDLDLAWKTPKREPVRLAGRFRYFANGSNIDALELQLAGQSITGSGCFETGPAPWISLDLSAERLDLDRLEREFDFTPGGAGGLPMQVNARLRATELVRGGVEARGVLLEYGGAVDCP